MPLEQPFFVLATQNPIEQEGTYPLPEAQLDRFLLNIRVNYPERDEEFEILKATTVEEIPEVTEILCGEDILELQRKVRRIPVADHVFDYALTLIRKTRPRGADAPEFVREWLDFGAGPRAGQNLILAAKARALMLGRMHAHCGDIAALAKPVLRHRLITNFNANADNVDVDLIIANILDETPFAEI
jgi:MoxR-like ATPase